MGFQLVDLDFFHECEGRMVQVGHETYIQPAIICSSSSAAFS